MTEAEFLDRLLVHYGKRHASPQAEQMWMRDMMLTIKGTDRQVLSKAYELVLKEHDERAFPLPAQLRIFITRACDLVYPEHHMRKYEPLPEITPTDEASKERVRQITKLVAAALRGKSIPQMDLPPLQTGERE